MSTVSLVSFVVTLGCVSNMVEAKYCPIEIDGDVKYYICPRNEICCTFGCCISSNFHFYQLWYYWLMVILMFLLCSGGTWWYRYWLQEGHYPHHPPQPTHRPTPRPRPPTRMVSYHPSRNTVVVHQIWKPQRNGPMNYPAPPPAYSLVQNSTSEQSTASGASGGVPAQLAKTKSSPYYQLYGPPPSYETVITETLAERSVNSGRHTPDPEQTTSSSCGTQEQMTRIARGTLTESTDTEPCATRNTCGTLTEITDVELCATRNTRGTLTESTNTELCAMRSNQREDTMALP